MNYPYKFGEILNIVIQKYRNENQMLIGFSNNEMKTIAHAHSGACPWSQ